MQTVRTTIRIRKDLLDQSKILALQKGTSVQDVVNEVLAQGLWHITDLNLHQQAMTKIDTLRERMRGKHVHLEELLEQNKKDQK